VVKASRALTLVVLRHPLDTVIARGFRLRVIASQLRSLNGRSRPQASDPVVINLYSAHAMPFAMETSRVQALAKGTDVDTVMVHGQVLMEDRQVKTVDEMDVLGMGAAGGHAHRRGLRTETGDEALGEPLGPFARVTRAAWPPARHCRQPRSRTARINCRCRELAVGAGVEHCVCYPQVSNCRPGLGLGITGREERPC
jgi:hypothetical protein